MRGVPWWLAQPRLARQCFFKRGFCPLVARQGPSPAGRGRQPGVRKDCTPSACGWLLDASKSPPQGLAKFYRKSVAVFGRRNARAALRSCCSINKTYRPTAYPLIVMGGIPI
jgi:hypothetical protein